MKEPTKNEAEWFLNDCKPGDRPRKLQKMLNISGSTTNKPGEWWRRNFPKEFDNWYQFTFLKSFHDKATIPEAEPQLPPVPTNPASA